METYTERSVPRFLLLVRSSAFPDTLDVLQILYKPAEGALEAPPEVAKLASQLAKLAIRLEGTCSGAPPAPLALVVGCCVTDSHSLTLALQVSTGSVRPSESTSRKSWERER